MSVKTRDNKVDKKGLRHRIHTAHFRIGSHRSFKEKSPIMPGAAPTALPPSAVAMSGRLYCKQIINSWKCCVMSSPLIKTSTQNRHAKFQLRVCRVYTLILTFKTCLLHSHRSYITIHVMYCRIARL